jgi:uncharacterized membrane protein YsdA (DUF1294 family)
VTVVVEDAQTGRSVATQTLAARDLNDAAARVAAYVARQIFRQDPTAPPWSVGSFDGSDLAALLSAGQQRDLIDCPKDAHQVRCRQIEEFEKAVCNSPGAGVARYELALLYDLERNHTRALWLHAINRKQYPRFFRGRYRLGMSLEMIANPQFGTLKKEAWDDLRESLHILDQCGITGNAEDSCEVRAAPLSAELRKELLTAARNELRAYRRHLTLWRLIWATFWHRDERAIRNHYWRLRERQRFHDGVRVAELLVAVRQSLNEQECERTGEDCRQAKKVRRRPERAMHITAVITGDITAIQALLDPEALDAPKGGEKERHPGAGAEKTKADGKKWHPGAKAGKTRWLPWQRRTPSWQAAYNAACLYAALACSDKYQQNKLALLALRCLDRVVNDRLCEMERPWDWISTDPDLHCLKKKSEKFRAFLDDQKQKDYPRANNEPDRYRHLGAAADALTGLPAATEARSSHPQHSRR